MYILKSGSILLVLWGPKDQWNLYCIHTFCGCKWMTWVLWKLSLRKMARSLFRIFYQLRIICCLLWTDYHMHFIYPYLQQQFTAHLLEKQILMMTIFSGKSPLIDETFTVTSISTLRDPCWLGARLSSFHLLFEIWFSAGWVHWCCQFWMQVSIGLLYRSLADVNCRIQFGIAFKQSVISIWS